MIPHEIVYKYINPDDFHPKTTKSTKKRRNLSIENKNESLFITKYLKGVKNSRNQISELSKKKLRVNLKTAYDTSHK